MLVAFILTAVCSSNSRCCSEKEGVDTSFLPEVVMDVADDVIDKDSALQAEVCAYPQAVKLHQGHVEDCLSLQGVRHL